jgi:hypothetical protein
VAPFDVHIVVLPGLEEQSAELEERLEAAGLSVLLDDRDLRAGEKFADADLIGCPVRITVGKKTLDDGAVDVLMRETGMTDECHWKRWRSMARKRRFSEESFGPTAIRLMDETGVTYRGLAGKTGLSAGYLNHIMHGNRPVPSNEVIDRLPRRWASNRNTFSSTACG